MSCASKRDYFERIYPRYRQVRWAEKRKILDEFCANCGYHRKYAIRLLNGAPPGKRRAAKRRQRSVTYGSQLVSILKAVWETADYPWSARLKALLPEWMPWIRRHYRLTRGIEKQLLQISARSIDRRLSGEKRKWRRRLYGRTKPGTLLKHHIPLKTDHWDVEVPGFTEIDLVSHSGNSAAGEFCYSLNVTDIHTGWTETRAVLGKGQEAVRTALEAVREALPFPLRGIDSDNGSEFINDHLWRYCQARAIQFTRGRPYKKDDNAHIEQKNWTHVRRQLGYVRYDTEAAREAINDLYVSQLRLFQNLFLPSVKLEKKERVGSRLRRRYEAPQTPWQRVLASPATDPERVRELERLRATLDPFQLAETIQAKLERIFQLSTSVGERNGELSAPPQLESTTERKAHRRARAKAKTARGEKAKAKAKSKSTTKGKGKAKRRRRVTFLDGKTIRQKLHSYMA